MENTKQIKNYSIKDLYINLQNLYNNAVNILTGLNQAMQTDSNEVTITLMDSDDILQTVRIPSFLHLENKLEQLELQIDDIFKIPKNGEAWFNRSNNMYKLQMVQNQTAPVTPIETIIPQSVKIKNNLVLKDLVSPKTYLKFNLSNLPGNINKIFMKKIIFKSSTLFDYFKGSGFRSYSDYKNALYNYQKGESYEEYDSELSLPVKENFFKGDFSIIQVIKSYYDYNISENQRYDLLLSDITYYSEEDASNAYNLAIGDKLWLKGKYNKYEIIDIDPINNIVTVEEVLGHQTLTNVYENSEMVLYYEEDNYERFNYVEVPLEEDQYICIFLGTIYNGVRSALSTPYLFNLGELYMDMEDGTSITYMDFYKKYCKNIGDIILGITEYAYPQITDYNKNTISFLQNDDEGGSLKPYISKSLSEDNIKVVLINGHLTKDQITEELNGLVSEKTQINEDLSNIQSKINEISSTIKDTDFSQGTTSSFEELSGNLKSYQSKKTALLEQLKTSVDNINLKINELSNYAEPKYRLRGLIKPNDFLNYIQSSLNINNVDIIQIDVEYRYKSTSSDIASLTTYNSIVFTNWNKFEGKERDRIILSNGQTVFEDYDIDSYENSNVIKWNQIDIPIQQGEDIVIRVRFKYNIGYPQINLYSPWSNEMEFVFPAEYENNSNIETIVSDNSVDQLSSTIASYLIENDFYDHINNKVNTGDKIFYHQPDNIYSGFSDKDSKMMSLKDKLNDMNGNIEKISNLFDELNGGKYSISIFDSEENNNIDLVANTESIVNFYNKNHITNNYIQKDLQLVIKNTGDKPIKLYSIFPGDINKPLLSVDEEYYNKYIGHYESYPLFINDKLSYQRLGQWIYFRTDNPYTNQSFLYYKEGQKTNDINCVRDGNENVNWIFKWVLNTDDTDNSTNYIGMNNVSPGLGYRLRSDDLVNYTINQMDKVGGTYTKMLTKKNIENVVENKSAKNIDNSSLVTLTKGNSIATNSFTINMNNQQVQLSDGSIMTVKAVNNSPIINGKEYLVDMYNKIYNNDDSSWLNNLSSNAELNISQPIHIDDYLNINDQYALLSPNFFMYRKDDEYNKNYILRYKDIKGQKDINGNLINLDKTSDITKFINVYNLNNILPSLNINDYQGACLYVDLSSLSRIITDDADKKYKLLNAGESTAIPIKFEFFLRTRQTIEKSLYFDIKINLSSEASHYMIKFIGNADSSLEGDLINSESASYTDEVATV